MDRAQKRELVSTLNEAWKDSGVLVVAHYAGMTVAQMTEFRKRMKEAGGWTPTSHIGGGYVCAGAVHFWPVEN